MAFLRVDIDLAFPMPLSKTIRTRLDALQGEIKKAKKYARKINEGQANEEATVRGVYRICHHDENNMPCEPEVEI